MKDVLIFCPVYRLEPETVLGVFDLEWDGPLSILFQRDNPGGGGRRDHLHQYQRGRETFLSGRWDGMLVIESDIIPPADTLTRLAALETDLAYGVYVFRGTDHINVSQLYPQPSRNRGSSLTATPGLWEQACLDGVVKCSGQGFGCILIRRNVLEAVEFHITDPRPDGGAHCDTYFHNDVFRKGFEMKADTFVLCGHKDEETGEIVFPRRLEP